MKDINNDARVYAGQTEVTSKETTQQFYKNVGVTLKVIAIASGLIGAAAVGAVIFMPALAPIAVPVAAIAFVLSLATLSAMVYAVKKYKEISISIAVEVNSAQAFNPANDEL